MKRIMIIAMVLMLALSTMTAWAAPGDAIIGGPNTDGTYNVYYTGAFSIGDTLYLTNSDGLSTWHLNEADAVSYEYRFPSLESDGEASWSCVPFAANDKVYALAFVTRYAEKTEFLRAVLCEVSLTEEEGVNVAKLTEKTKLNWEGMINYYEQDSTATEPQSCVGMGNLCCMLIYDDSSNLNLKLLNVDTGEIKTAEDLKDISAITPYKDGALLVEQFSYSEENIARFIIYDPGSESSRQIAEIKTENGSALAGLAYDADADALYCIKGGEIHRLDLQKGEIGPAIADAPAEYVNDAGACILNGGYYCHGSAGAFVRNLDLSQRTETRIRVFDNSYSDSVQAAVVKLASAHGDISVAIDRDYNVGERLVESMLNRDSSVDVYIVNGSDEAFSAVYNRGYMAELDGSDVLAALMKRMYPSLQNAMSRDGHLVCIPLTCSGSTFGVNEKALERLGLKLEDVPHNWKDMLDFIDALSSRIKPEDKVHLFYSGETFETAKANLFNQLFQDYQNYANHADPIVGYDTELLRGLLGKLDAIDFTKFGCQRESAAETDASDSEGDFIDDDDNSLSLFETFSGCTFGEFYSDYTPVLMSMDADTPTYLVLNMNIAFINPYTEHPREALLYMEQLSNSLGVQTLYSIDPSLDTPIRNSYYEETLKGYEETLASLRAQLESAEASDKQALEDQLRELEQEKAAFEQSSWDISRANIDWYRANDDNIVLQGFNWLYRSDFAGEASDLIERYLSGQIDASALLTGIDKKLTMMRLEANAQPARDNAGADYRKT